MKKIITALLIASGLLLGAAVSAQTVFPSGGVDLTGNAGSPVIGVYNQSPFPVIAVACGGARMNMAHPIAPNGLAQINFGRWSCPSGSTILAYTANGQQHVIPWVDIRRTTMITIRW